MFQTFVTFVTLINIFLLYHACQDTDGQKSPKNDNIILYSMLWQDWVFSVGQVVFLIALIPTIRGKDKPALTTSAVTSLILAFFAYTYFTLELWFSTVSSIAMTAAWATLAIQKYLQDKK